MDKLIPSPIKNCMAIHDLSCYGRCALTVVIPVLSAMGIQVTPLPTAFLSTHTGDFENFVFEDMTNMMPKICLFALVCSLLAVLLKSMGFGSVGLMTTLGALLILSAVGGGFADIFGSLASFSEGAGIAEAAKSALRVVGLGYIFGFTSEICTSLGESLIASVVTTAGRVEMFLVALPYIKRVVELGTELLS